MRLIYLAMLLLYSLNVVSQNTYFPPVNGDWDQWSFEEVNIDENRVENLYTFLDEKQSKSFMLLIDGKIALEYYSEDHNETKAWYWASAGKTLTSSLVGIAQQEGHLSIQDKTSDYLGNDWTQCPDEKITIWNQLTMTSGLDYTLGDIDCTDPECLQCLNEEGQEWFYHNAPYTLLEKVVANASGKTYNTYTRQSLTNKIGMTGSWIPLGFNNVYWSNTQSFARFGLLLANKGNWDGEQIIPEDYHTLMTTPSQAINPSYGYLTWLNGQDSYRLPSTTFNISGSMFPSIPSDAYMALGKNSQICMVVPSRNMVLIRMGDDPDNSLVPTAFMNELWQKVEDIFITTSTDNLIKEVKLYPNPVGDWLRIDHLHKDAIIDIADVEGNVILSMRSGSEIEVADLRTGIYFVIVRHQLNIEVLRFVKIGS